MTSPRIFLLTTDDNTPSGWRRVIYTLVDLLREQGVEAYALHQQPGFRYTWFENNTPVLWTHEILQAKHRERGLASQLKLKLLQLKKTCTSSRHCSTRATITPNDTMIIPENRVLHLDRIFPGVPKIVFNQNPYLFAQQAGLSDSERTLRHPDIRGWIAVSKLIMQQLQFLGVPQPVYRIPNFIDSSLFNDCARKKRQIAYMPPRLKNDASAVINLLKIRGNLQGFEFVAIDGQSPQAVAAILKESLIFLSFSHREGFGLPPAEAMACGCIVIGYTGNAGDEFMDPEFCYPIQAGDLNDFTLKIESLIHEHSNDRTSIEAKAQKASQRILKRYSREKSAEAVKLFWTELLRLRG
jgi:hypothetical protein